MTKPELRDIYFNNGQDENALMAIYKQGRADVLKELFVTHFDFFNGESLHDVYCDSLPTEFDEGWNKCYEDVRKIAECLSLVN